jgi:hypothetical protein
MEYLVPGRVCIFCGGNDLTNEHIWSDFLKEIVSSRDSSTTVNMGSIPHFPFREQEREATVSSKSWRGAPWNMKVKVVCRKCNNEWMSRIVNRAKPILKRLLQGDRLTLSSRDQQSLAAWIALVCITSERMSPKRIVVPAVQRRYLLHHEIASGDWSIALGVYTGQGFVYRLVRMSLKGERFSANPYDRITQELETLEEAAVNAGIFTFIIGRLFVQAFLCVDDLLKVANDYVQWVDGNNKLVRIWPPRRFWPFPARSLQWPPAESMDDKAARAVAGSFYHRITMRPSYIH